MPSRAAIRTLFATLSLSVAFSFSGSLQAAGRTSAAFLQLGSGARASGMGDAFTAVADDASATHWNPAGLASLTKRELLAEHALHLQGIGIERLAYAHPLRRGSQGPALGFSGVLLHLVGIEARTGNTAQPDRTFGASDMSAAVSYAHPLSSGRFAANLGLTAKFIQQRIDSRQATASAFDVGVTQQAGKRLRLGATLANLGSGVRFIEESYPLPQTLRLGAAYRPRRLPMTFALGADLPRHDDASYRLGAEYSFGEALSFRLGYTARPGASSRALKGSALGTVSDGELAKITGMVGGVGFRFFGYGVDYAFQPYGELGNTHKVSLSARFK